MYGNLGVVFCLQRSYSQNKNSGNKRTLQVGIYTLKCFSQILGTLQLEHFVSRLSDQIPSYREWRPDPYSQEPDAMQQNLSKEILYVFSPSSTSQSSSRSNIKLLLITPAYQTQPWYPQLLGIFISNPLLQPKEYPLVEEKILRPMVWKILGNSYICQEFHRWFSNLSQE